MVTIIHALRLDIYLSALDSFLLALASWTVIGLIDFSLLAEHASDD